jgi:iron complex transport system ATP-binding protein
MLASDSNFVYFGSAKKTQIPTPVKTASLSFMSLRFEYVSFSFPGTPVLRNLSLIVSPGDFLSILGPNGSGKSTLLRLAGRILLPSDGSVHINSRLVEQYTRKELARLIGYVPQETAWIYPFTVLETILMGRTPHLGGIGFERESDLAIAREAMELADIIHLAEKSVTALSGGERQRVLIARALCQKPQILLLDEPNAHLDLAHQVELFALLKKENSTRGLTVVSVSHDLNLAANFSKHILLLKPAHSITQDEASVFAYGTPGDVLTSSNLSDLFQTPVRVDRRGRHGAFRIYPTQFPTLKRKGIRV